MGTRSILAYLLLLWTTNSTQGAVEAPSAGNLGPFLYTVAGRYETLAWMQGGERFPAGASIFVRDSRGSHPLVPHFVASADPAVSFDGARVLFAGKLKPDDPWQIWEVLTAGGEPRRVTIGHEDCVRPFYLPEDRLIYTRKRAERFEIEIADLAGGKPLTLTYGPANFLPTDVLRDGRILFEAGYPLGSETTPEIYTVYSDGSGMESYRCDHGNHHHQARQIVSGDIVFASRSGLSRFTSARAQELAVAAPAGEYAGDIAETSSGVWLVSWRSTPIAPFRLMTWKPGSGRLSQALAEHDASVIQPVPLGARAVPNRHPSGLHDWAYANLLCLNAYTSKYSFPAESIRAVRLYSRDSGGNARLLGTASVERDGSFFLQVPAEQALQIELLDGSGKTLKRQAGFFWMRRGEQRVCVGCHAGPETAPENAVPMILLKSTIPADLTGSIAGNSSGGH